MLKRIITILFLTTLGNLFAQTMNIHTKNGNVDKYNLSDIDSITFNLNEPNKSYLINEDFESYAINTFPSSGGWVLVYNGYGTSYQFVSDSSSISGSKSLQLEGQSNWAAVAKNEFIEKPSVIYFEGNVKTKKLEPSVMNYNVARFGLWENTWYIVVDFYYNGDIRFSAKGLEPIILGKWTSSKWYKIKIRCDNNLKIADVYINDILKANNIDISNVSVSYNSIALEGGNDTHTRSWFDDIKVWYEE